MESMERGTAASEAIGRLRALGLRDQVRYLKTRAPVSFKEVQHLFPQACPQRYAKAAMPVYLAALEQAMLYPNLPEPSPSPETPPSPEQALEAIADTIRQEVEEADLKHLHQMVVTTLGASFANGYTDQYDRWLVMTAIKVLSINRSDKYLLEYFQVITQRLEGKKMLFRDRGIILSDYITENNLSHHSPETGYFAELVPSKPIVEEDSESAEEDYPTEEEITTLAEYASILTDTEFVKKTDAQQERIIKSIDYLIPKEKPYQIKKHYLSIVEALVSLGTLCALEAASELLAVEDTSCDILRVIYHRTQYSFYFRSTTVRLILQVLPKLSQTTIAHLHHHLAQTLNLTRTALSEEDRKLGLDMVWDRLVLRLP
ncbi:hypothetical protein NEDG_01858 [Nematocida displodere]|uniref:Uncharacterized protein n=1 Tax=Nematocida displodere TaxID=1805483 RepID=A0A177EGJ4_9MICR|nr:hypothetical protein NEDG_01858 [Nematocida displodere]